MRREVSTLVGLPLPLLGPRRAKLALGVGERGNPRAPLPAIFLLPTGA